MNPIDTDTNGANGAAALTQPSADEAEAFLAQFTLPDTFSLVTESKAPPEIEVGKPGSKTWAMAHPTLVHRTAIVTMEEERTSKIYLVQTNAVQYLDREDLQMVDLHLATTIDGNPFLWPARIGTDMWATSMQSIIALAKGTWVRVRSERGDRKTGGRYVARTPDGNLPPPAWPNESFASILMRAAKDRVIDGPNHPVVKALAGKSKTRREI